MWGEHCTIGNCDKPHDCHGLCKKHYHLMRKYGLSRAEVEWASKLKRCPICARKPTRSKANGLVVDHDHDTGDVRDVICHPCNTAIAMADDNPEYLRLMADYLVRHGR